MARFPTDPFFRSRQNATISHQVPIDTEAKKGRIYAVGGVGVAMPKMNVRTATVVAILALVLPSYSQNNVPAPDPKPAPQAKDASKPEKQHFYYHSWNKGEYKVCQTYSGAPGVVLCDSADDAEWSNSFMNIIAGNGRAGIPEDQSYHQALAFASSRGKTFLATFSDDPWPKPQTGLKLSVWNCTKDKDLVACELGGRVRSDE
jgi:hypothetical protein